MTSKQVPLKMATQDFADVKIRRYGRKKKVRHSKNPYQVKQYIIPEYEEMKPKVLDGYLLLKVTKNDLPHEILTADLSKLRITEAVVEDLKYFINLKDLDISENFINLEDMIYFQSLEELKIAANQIEDFNLPQQVFEKLKYLDLSYNRVIPPAIENLQVIQNLRHLNLESNDLRELPEELSKFQHLNELNLNNNYFESNQYGASFWYSLSTIKKLKKLYISKNALRGIHTAKLVPGNLFQNLELLDFSYNLVEDQHNLICARNFKNLKKLIVTGNPFASQNKHLGLEMELKARNGGDLINEKQSQYYLKKQKEQRPGINYGKLKKIKDDNYARDKNYFMGIEMPQDLEQNNLEGEEDGEEQYDEQVDQQIDQELNEQMSDQEDENEDQPQAMFLTEDPNQKGEKKKKQQNRQNQDQFQDKNFNLENNNNIQQQMQQQLQYMQANQQEIPNQNMPYDQLMKIVSQNIGDSKDYEQAYELQTAYKTLKNVANNQDNYEFKEYEQPHYMQSTKSIRRLKPNEQQDKQ